MSGKLIYTAGLVDSRNEQLWNKLNKVFDIEIKEQVGIANYSVYTIHRTAIIFIPLGNRNSASFTHELLHIFLRTQNISVGLALKSKIENDSVLFKIFTKELIQHFDNCLEHIKMLPEYIRLGYNRENFLTDYTVNKLTTKEVKNIKWHFNYTLFIKKRYKIAAVNVYIGKFFAARACPNDSIDYSIALSELKLIDNDLFDILNTFFYKWYFYDYNDGSTHYDEFVNILVTELSRWTERKTFY